VIVVGGGHAGIEAAWAAANLLGPDAGGAPVALVTLDPERIGEMSCNPAIGGLAKGQLVREVDALGGLMGLIADATGIMFKVLNTSRGPAVRGPRCQSDKHAYAEVARAYIRSRPEIEIIAGRVERLLTGRPGPGLGRQMTGIEVVGADDVAVRLEAGAVVLTTGTFMRGLMHTGDEQTPGGRFGEDAAQGISGALTDLGFELGRLKTGTPPRIGRKGVDWDELPEQAGDVEPAPFSDLTLRFETGDTGGGGGRFPVLEQVCCRQTRTCAESHELIRKNLHRAPLFSGQIEGTGPRYCPSIEDKVVRFTERESHGVFLEPESLRTDWVYCNGISTSLPRDVQDRIVRLMPGCARAEILRHGYAVEYDMVRPHQIHATGMTKLVEGLFLAGQINGTSGYEEAAAQGLVAGVNAVRWSHGQGAFLLGRDQAYIGVLMDDLVTKTPTEPYRMFTSRAEHRLLLRADNAADRLTPIADELGLLSGTDLGRFRREVFDRRAGQLAEAFESLSGLRVDGVDIETVMRRSGFARSDLETVVSGQRFDRGVLDTVLAEIRYRPYIERDRRTAARQSQMESRPIPAWVDFEGYLTLRTEAREALMRFRPDTLGQASRLEGITPADMTLLTVLLRQSGRTRADEPGGEQLADHAGC
jgi:tRNA uridine 5-carboxymethylaminomethyl modification enzyme